jgi:hypothetical protein
MMCKIAKEAIYWLKRPGRPQSICLPTLGFETFGSCENTKVQVEDVLNQTTGVSGCRTLGGEQTILLRRDVG